MTSNCSNGKRPLNTDDEDTGRCVKPKLLPRSVRLPSSNFPWVQSSSTKDWHTHVTMQRTIRNIVASLKLIADTAKQFGEELNQLPAGEIPGDMLVYNVEVVLYHVGQSRQEVFETALVHPDELNMGTFLPLFQYERLLKALKLSEEASKVTTDRSAIEGDFAGEDETRDVFCSMSFRVEFSEITYKKVLGLGSSSRTNWQGYHFNTLSLNRNKIGQCREMTSHNPPPYRIRRFLGWTFVPFNEVMKKTIFGLFYDVAFLLNLSQKLKVSVEAEEGGEDD